MRITIVSSFVRKVIAAVAPKLNPIGLRIFTYHRIQDEWCAPMVVSARSFKRQLQYLSHHFSIITFAQLLQLIRSKQLIDSRRPLAIITFDDGYRDNITVAAPILEGLGISACFFVTTSYIGTTRRFAWDEDRAKDASVMSWRDVRELRRRGFEVGSHGMSHRRMSQLSDEEFEGELAGSRRILEDELGERVPTFAYPFGRFRDCSSYRKRIVGRYYQIANTSIRGLNRPERLSLLELRRTSVNGVWSQGEFCAEAAGVFDVVDTLRLLTSRP